MIRYKCLCILPISIAGECSILIYSFPQAAMFLSCLATDIVVGLGSWVESDAQKVENTKTETDDQLEVLK